VLRAVASCLDDVTDDIFRCTGKAAGTGHAASVTGIREARGRLQCPSPGLGHEKQRGGRCFLWHGAQQVPGSKRDTKTSTSRGIPDENKHRRRLSWEKTGKGAFSEDGNVCCEC